MKFQVTFKTPDVVRDAAGEAARHEANLQWRKSDHTIPMDDYDDLKNEIWDALIKFTNQWVKYGKSITVEFDVEKGTATVLPAGE